tara:strand:- start:386 stop:1006 length:621 start_codon:yes stop_codon:yes gene_type:complete
MISIINYGLGNIRAFKNIFDYLNIKNQVADSVTLLNNSSKIILPGVGSFDHAMDLINKSGLRNALEDLVINKEIPLLGICVGMQILGNQSDEGKSSGLGFIDGEIKLFNNLYAENPLPLPHMGWNSIISKNNDKLLSNIELDSRFYFLHSYYFSCNDEINSISKTRYGIDFSSSVNKKNIYGVQFHPEKSHLNGINLLKNFSELEF